MHMRHLLALRVLPFLAPSDLGGGGDGGGASDTAPLSVDAGVALLRSARQPDVPETKTNPPVPAPQQQAAEPDPDAAAAPKPGPEAEQAPEPGPDDAGEGEPAPPAIEPPKSWSKADQEAFLQLPPETQAIIARRESERDKAFQAKATEAAEHRKAAEARVAAADAERAQYAQNLNALAQEILGERGAEPDWQKLAAENPAEYVQQRAAWDARQQQLHKVFAERQRIEAQQLAEHQKRMDAHLAAENARLVDAVPGWKDDQGRMTPVARKEFGDVMAYLGKDYGYTPADLDGIADHRLVVVARKAMLYDRAQAAVATAPKPVPQVQRPGTAPGRHEANAVTRDALVKRVERGGDIKDAVALLRANRSR